MVGPFALSLWGIGSVGKEPLGGCEGSKWGDGVRGGWFCFCRDCFCFESGSSSALASAAALWGEAKRTCSLSSLSRFSTSGFVGFHGSACSGAQRIHCC